MQRKLAAILAGDVVGYSHLMEADEAGTLARLKSAREMMARGITGQFETWREGVPHAACGVTSRPLPA